MHLCFLVPPVPIQLLDLPTQKKNETSKTCNNYIQKSIFVVKQYIYFRYIRIKIDKKNAIIIYDITTINERIKA